MFIYRLYHRLLEWTKITCTRLVEWFVGHDFFIWGGGGGGELTFVSH